MKLKTGIIISTVIIILLLISSGVLMMRSINLKDLNNTLFIMNNIQTSYLILFFLCLIILFNIAEASAYENRVKSILVYNYINKTFLHFLQKTLHWIITVILLVFGLLLPIINFFGVFKTSENTQGYILKVILIIITTSYLHNLFDKSKREIRVIRNILNDKGIITFLNREQDHSFMSDLLDEIPFGSEVLVTHFEEPINKLNTQGYYYEKKFMKKWYSVIKEKELIIKQIILINSKQDLEDFKRRLNIIKDIKNFSLGYIIAPPLMVFIDFVIFPEDVLLGFSDNPSMKNMNVFGLQIHKGKGVEKFRNLFNDVLSKKAVFVKTFEGINENKLQRLEKSCEEIMKYSKKSRIFFKIFTNI